MTEEEQLRYRAHVQTLLKQCKHLVLSEIDDEDLTEEIKFRLLSRKSTIIDSVNTLKGGGSGEWH